MAWTPIPPILATTSVTLDIMEMQHLTLWFGFGGVQHYLDMDYFSYAAYLC